MPESAQSGFELKTHAFQFENFAYGYDASRMTPDLAARMFGEENVCRSGFDECAPTPAAEAWIDSANRAMEMGRCEGFAVLSQLFYLGRLDPEDFGAESAADMELWENYALQRELAYWFSTQLVPQAVESTALMPREAVPFMAEFMGEGSEEFYRIGMAQRTADGFGEAHSLTPIGFEQGETSDIYYVRVYDNNFPDVERQIRLDVKENTWEYQGVSEIGAITFEGGEALDNPLYFAPTAAREGTLPCPFCEDTGTVTVTAQGAMPLLTDGEGNEVGVKDGEVLEQGGGKVSPGFALCAGDRSTVQLTANVTSDMPLEVTVAKGKGKHQSLTVQGGKLGTVEVSGELTGETSGQLQITQDAVSLQAGGDSSKVRFTIGTTQIELDISGKAGDVRLAVDPDTGELSVTTDDASDTQVTVTLVDNSDPRAANKPRTSFSVTGSEGASELTIELPEDGYRGGRLMASLTADGMTSALSSSHCGDGTKNEDETDVDCGGSVCGACAPGGACLMPRDCAEGTCASASASDPNTCVDTCLDGREDDDETDVDCGGVCFTDFRAACAAGEGCEVDTDCVAGNLANADAYANDPTTFCSEGACVAGPRIGGVARDPDGYHNFFPSPLGVTLTSGDYSATVWPGPGRFAFQRPRVDGAYTVEVSEMPLGRACEVVSGASGNATGAAWVDDIEVVCRRAVYSCYDDAQTEDETDVDCGGPSCNRIARWCAVGQSCLEDADCGSQFYARVCDSGVCAQTYSLAGNAYTTVPVTVELTPGGDTSAGPSATPRQITVAPADTRFAFTQTRVTGDYALSVVAQTGVTCAFSDLPASPIEQASEWAPDFSLRCTSCGNGAQEGLETDVDCGGADCVAEGRTCGSQQSCQADSDCASGNCTDGACAGNLCENDAQDSGETDVDCGGSCVSQGLTCALTEGCEDDADCASGICDADSSTCVSCSDGAQNGDETGTDCGGAACVDLQQTCALGAGCAADSDCSSGICDTDSNTCVSCSDGAQNGDETGTDCGGSACVDLQQTCALGGGCAADADCSSGICDTGSNTCVSCSDGQQNGAETATDCGGAACRASGDLCAAGEGCSVNGDCESGTFCDGGTCAAVGSWSETATNLFSAAMVDDATAIAANDIWASGGDYLAHYDGSTWSEQTPLGSDYPITGMFALNDGFTTSVWVLGEDNGLQEWNGSSWFAVGIDFTGNPIAQLNDIHGTETLMFVVGSEGQIAQRDEFTGDFASDGGGGFPLPPVTSEDLHAVYVLDDSNAWTVGNGGVILSFNGGMWNEETSPTSSPLRDVWALASDDVWAVGDGGTVVHYDGVSWSTVASGVTSDLKSVWAAGAGQVWMVGAGGTVLRWDGSGIQQETSNTTADLGVVFGFDTTRWAMGTDAVLIERN